LYESNRFAQPPPEIHFRRPTGCVQLSHYHLALTWNVSASPEVAMVVKGKKSTKNPPVLSHEFIIQNHADIVACVAMVFVVGLMFQVSSPAASVFIALHHNVTVPVEIQPGVFQDVAMYTQGMKDVPAIFFYLLISVVMHAIIQEYLLDKVNKKLHLSKIKHAKFNESGQLLAFFLMSIFWAGDILLRENLLSVASLWEGYPHTGMTFLFKFFFIIQLSYWLHVFPELYFQKTKREDWAPKIQDACLYIAFILGAYVTSFTRVALFLLLVHYLAEVVFHTCRILAYLNQTSVASKLFKLGDLLFVLARLSSVILAVLTFWFGLASLPAELQVLDLATGNYNSPAVRLAGLLAVCLLQAWLMWNFIMFQVKRAREAGPKAVDKAQGGKAKSGKTEQEKAKARKARKEEEDAMLPEADQKIKTN